MTKLIIPDHIRNFQLARAVLKIALIIELGHWNECLYLGWHSFGATKKIVSEMLLPMTLMDNLYGIQ